MPNAKNNASPRITARFDVDTHAAAMAWGASRGMATGSEALRGLVAEGLSRPQDPVQVRAYRAAYEQGLAEVRQATRQILIDVVAKLKGRVR